MEDLHELIKSSMSRLYHGLLAPKEVRTPKFGRVDPGQLTKYKTPVLKTNITTFESIGMPDPYPNEDAEDEEHQFLMPEGPRDLVYEQDAYTPDRCPKPRHLPSRTILLKLMRACIGVTDVDKLWCYVEEPEPSPSEEEIQE